MNLLHRWFCGSASWKNVVETYILPWALEGLNLGSDVLEVGPGPGASTDILRACASRLTCIETDRAYADRLQRRYNGSVRVMCEDAAAMSLGDRSFDAVLSFSMLHHVPSAGLQDRLLAEAARVLRSGGIFAGTDSLYSHSFRLLHLFDTMVIVDPETFPGRLQAAGFCDVQVDVMKPYAFRFRARKAAD
jgi:SAM-dependent methyltransferase